MSAVHPRLRGELCNGVYEFTVLNGSSPLARGTLLGGPSSGRSLRFIPACAGNSMCRKSPCANITVHPRLRGELSLRISPARIPVGSSPLARGTQSGYSEGHNVLRFIPACAGNSSKVENTEVSGTVHPRLRGELTKACTPMGVWNGSSPLARGTLLRDTRVPCILRFIPACAGNSVWCKCRQY